MQILNDIKLIDQWLVDSKDILTQYDFVSDKIDYILKLQNILNSEALFEKSILIFYLMISLNELKKYNLSKIELYIDLEYTESDWNMVDKLDIIPKNWEEITSILTSTPSNFIIYGKEIEEASNSSINFKKVPLSSKDLSLPESVTTNIILSSSHKNEIDRALVISYSIAETEK